MLFLPHFLTALVSLVVIIYACSLFTDAIEHLGENLKLGNSAVGSILAVAGTGLPETIVPLVAIFGALLFKNDMAIAQDIALGAIIGSPFILATLGLFLLGVLLFAKKRKNLELDYKNVIREYKYFLIAYPAAILAGFTANKTIKLIIVFFLLSLYVLFIFRTIIKSKKNFIEQKKEDLFFCRLFKCDVKNENYCVILQLLISLLMLAVFSHFFVAEIKYFSNVLNISPLILSLIITPFATELPECTNSLIWLRDNKDDLALANITGAIVFQSVVPFSIGIMLTPWVFSVPVVVNLSVVLICSLIFITTVIIKKKVTLASLLFCGAFYLLFLTYLLYFSK